MLRRNRTQDQLAALFVLGAVLLLPPLLVIFSQPVLMFGVPLLYLYLFVVWAVLIGMTAAVVRHIVTEQRSDRMRPHSDTDERQSDA